MLKEGTYDQYTGVTTDPNDPGETSGPAPGSILIQLSLDERRLWNNLFKLYDSLSPFIEYLDSLDVSETPPDWLNQRWGFITDETQAFWPDYRSMRKTYQDAGIKLINEYERLKTESENIGIAVTTVVLIITVVSVGGAILFKFGGDFITSIKKDPETLRLEAETNRLQLHKEVMESWAAKGIDLKEHLKMLYKHDEAVAEDAGMSWPFLIEKTADLVKWAVIGLGAIFAWKIFS